MHVSTSKRIAASRDRVFEVLSDFANAAGRVSAIKRCEVLTPGPVGKGTLFRETRVMFGKQATETMEIIEWNPPSSYTVKAESCGCRYLSTVSCKPDGNGTIVEMSFSAEPLTFMARLFSPLAKVMANACRKAFDKDLNVLDRYLSGPAVQPA